MRLVISVSSSYILSSFFIFITVLTKLSVEINEGDRFPLKKYQELNYEDFKFSGGSNDDATNTARFKRDTSVMDAPLYRTNRLQFTAFNRRFKLILKKDTRLVADHFDIELRYPSSGRPTEHIHDFFSHNYYTGIVEDVPGSYVVCYFEQAPESVDDTTIVVDNDNDDSTTSNKQSQQQQPLVYAQISIKNDHENAVYYIEPILNTSSQSKPKYIVYRSEDIISDVISNGIFNHTVCKPKHIDANNETSNEDESMTIASEQIGSEESVLKRRKRQQANNVIRDEEKAKKNRCYLALVADHRFYKEIGNSDAKLTSAYLMNVIAAVNTIFLRTQWVIHHEDDDTDEILTNFGFAVEKIIILKEPTADRPDHYNHVNSSQSADKILESFGYEDWTSYCLAHLFTYQAFENSVLGLAYVSSPDRFSLGGICSRTATRARSFCVNTGLSSYKSSSMRQGRLLQREAELVTAHEFGHNWGSEHDPMKPECTPAAGMGGNFIMYAYANQGYERNNYNFSPCSITSISDVLKTKTTCFKAESLSFCGNDRVEALEECDGGFNGRQGLDPCCDYNCKLRSNAVCSDSNHECCRYCQIARANHKCYSSPNYIECFEEHSYCDGVNKTCPDQKPKPDNTTCNSIDSGRCLKGQCLSLCQQIDRSLFQCKCPQQDEKCMICCRPTLSNSTTDDDCLPIHRRFPNLYYSPQFMSDGRPCYDGLCENRVCQQRVKDYVSRFWKVIKTVSVSGFFEFMKRNIVGSIIIISLTFWVPFSCCIHFCIDKRQRAIAEQMMKQHNPASYYPVETENLDDPRYYDLKARNTPL